jgi:hypothetical protein
MIKPITVSDGLILQFDKVVKGFKDNQTIRFDVEYSGAFDDKLNQVTEFECIRVTEDSPILSESDVLDLEDLLECGYEETLCNELEKMYVGTDINFSPNHYESIL